MFCSGSHHQIVYGHVPIYGGRVQRKRVTLNNSFPISGSYNTKTALDLSQFWRLFLYHFTFFQFWKEDMLTYRSGT